MSVDSNEICALISGAKELGLTLNDQQAQCMLNYTDAIYEANEYINLTRVPRSSALNLHILDSLAIATCINVLPGWRILDVGTGAGFPGAILAIAFPQATVCLLDSTLKRLRVVDSILTELGISNAHIMHSRAEDSSQQPVHGSFDLVTARALASTDKLASWLLPYVRPGCTAVAYKSVDAMNEIREAEPEIKKLGGTLEDCERAVLPGTDIVRLFAIIRRNKTSTVHRPIRKR
jgi:16S rRNA (guanine527-N7)-methyltransferase